VRRAARAMGRHQLAHAYGHCSLRLSNTHFLVCAPMPMGLIPSDARGTVVAIEGELPAGVLGEVRLHQQIYRRSEKTHGICRTMPPHVVSLSAMGKVPQPRHGMGSYFWPQPALWRDVQLVRDNGKAEAAVTEMANSPALVLMGNGVVVRGESLEQACVLTWFLEDAARIELDFLKAGVADSMAPLSEEAASRRAIWGGGICERMWDFLTATDIESK
jgi:HCOMODA/2-hydroxy-3-carboxy-muconic semialdehyde decarboxylase